MLHMNTSSTYEDNGVHVWTELMTAVPFPSSRRDAPIDRRETPDRSR